MLILDVSEIQARKAKPQAREVSRLTWKAASIPQNAIPFTRDGKPYVLEFDEYTQGTTGAGDKHAVGAGRIIDIADERKPRVVANLRLQVNQPADHAAASSDPGASSPVQGYAAHYCSLSSQVDPTVVACSFIASGLRVFDISDLLHPKEIAYYVAPTQPRAENEFMASDFAMSQPAIVPSRREVWYTDGATGFNVVRIAPEVWPGRPRRGRPGVHGARLPLAQRSDRPPGHRARPSRDDPQGARAPAPRPAAEDQALVAVVRQGRRGHGLRGVHEVGPRRARRQHGVAPRQARGLPRKQRPPAAPPLSAPHPGRPRDRPRQPALHPGLRAPRREGPPRGRHHVAHDRPPPAAARLPAPRRPALARQVEAHNEFRAARGGVPDLDGRRGLRDQGEAEPETGAVDPGRQPAAFVADVDAQVAVGTVRFDLDGPRPVTVAVGVHDRVGHRLRDAQLNRGERLRVRALAGRELGCGPARPSGRRRFGRERLSHAGINAANARNSR